MAQDYSDPYKRHKFEVEMVDGPKVGGFEKISGLTMQMEVHEYQEGGVNDHVHSLPGQFTHETIILENGLVDNRVLFEWTDKVRKGEVPITEAKSNIEISVNHEAPDSKRWGFEVFDAYPVQWDGPDLRSTELSGEPAIQTLELAHAGFTNLHDTP